MTESAEPAGSGIAPPPLPEAPAAARGPLGRFAETQLVRVEDLVLAVWIALAAPLLVRAGNLQPFQTDRPIEGALILASVLAALVCLVTRTSDGAVARANTGASIGPLSGGVLLVAFAGFSALSAPSGWTVPIAIGGIAAVGIIRLRVASLPSTSRRALVTPFVLVSGSLFWGFVDAVIGPEGASGVTVSQLRDAVASGVPGAGTVALALLAFSAVYYAMLVYGPRQIADGEGNPLAWLVRYGLFVFSVLFGLGWVNALGL